MTTVTLKDQMTLKTAAYGVQVTRIEIEHDWATNVVRLHEGVILDLFDQERTARSSRAKSTTIALVKESHSPA